MKPVSLALALALASAAPATASGGGEADTGLGDLFWPAVNLAILLAALVHFGRRPIREFFAARHLRIREDLDSAARTLADAEARYSEWQRKLVELDADMARIRERARERAESEREHVLAAADAAAERIRADARIAVEQEVRRAREELRREAAELALALATLKLRARISAADHDRLADEFIETIERGGSDAAQRPGP